MKQEYETLKKTYSQYQKTLEEMNNLDKKIIELEGGEEIAAAAHEIMSLREQIKLLDEQTNILKKRLQPQRDELQQAVSEASMQDKQCQLDYQKKLHDEAYQLLTSDVVAQYQIHVLAAAELLRLAGVSNPLDTAQTETYIETVDYRSIAYTPGENPQQREEEAKRFNHRYHEQHEDMESALKEIGGPPKRPQLPKLIPDAQALINELSYWLD